jgi:hypothetical protein
VADEGWAIWIPVSHVSGFFIPAMLAIDILRQASIVPVGGFTVLGDVVMADMKDLAPESRWEWGQLETVSVEPSE